MKLKSRLIFELFAFVVVVVVCALEIPIKQMKLIIYSSFAHNLNDEMRALQIHQQARVINIIIIISGNNAEVNNNLYIVHIITIMLYLDLYAERKGNPKRKNNESSVNSFNQRKVHATCNHNYYFIFDIVLTSH